MRFDVAKPIQQTEQDSNSSEQASHMSSAGSLAQCLAQCWQLRDAWLVEVHMANCIVSPLHMAKA